jgi:hypothetical protein
LVWVASQGVRLSVRQGVHHSIGRFLQGKGCKRLHQSKAKERQGLKQGKASGRGAPRQRAHSSKASRHKEIKNSKASREELLLYQVL